MNVVLRDPHYLRLDYHADCLLHRSPAVGPLAPPADAVPDRIGHDEVEPEGVFRRTRPPDDIFIEQTTVWKQHHHETDADKDDGGRTRLEHLDSDAVENNRVVAAGNQSSSDHHHQYNEFYPSSAARCNAALTSSVVVLLTVSMLTPRQQFVT